MRISHEAIYQALYIQGRGALRQELTACLRSGRALRLPRERARNRGKSFLAEAIMISERPAEIEDRAVPGHWERSEEHTSELQSLMRISYAVFCLKKKKQKTKKPMIM